MPQSTLESAVRAALDARPDRVQRLDWGGDTYWIKRVEQLRGRMRLQKGAPDAAFRREVAALQTLQVRGVAVPEIALLGPDHVVLTDCGRTVLDWVQSDATTAEQRRAILVAAAEALAELHAGDLCHGRPAIRDLAWRDGRISFLDFENFDTAAATPRRKVRDLLVFAHSLYRWSFADLPEIDAALAAYRAQQPEVWQAARRWCRRNRWIGSVTRPLQNRRKGSKDFRPIPFLFRAFR